MLTHISGMDVFWKLVKGELRQQVMSYAEGFNVDLMHQGDQRVEQYANANRVTWAIVLPSLKMSSTASPYILLCLCHYWTAHPWMAIVAVTLYVTCRCSHPIELLNLKYAFLNHFVSLRLATGEIRKRVEVGESWRWCLSVWRISVRYESP